MGAEGGVLCPQAQNRRGPPETPDVSILPQRLPRECGPAATLFLDIWSPDLCKNKFLLFQASHFVALCSNGPRTAAQRPRSRVAFLQGTGVCCKKKKRSPSRGKGCVWGTGHAGRALFFLLSLLSDLCHREAPWPCPRSGQPWVCGDQVSPRGKPLGQPCPPLPPSVSLLSSPSSKTDPTDLLEGFWLILETRLFHSREGRTVGTDRR